MISTFLYKMIFEKNLQLLSKYGNCFHAFLCTVVTIYLVVITLFEYLKNEDTTIAAIKEFNQAPKDTYPTYTICLGDHDGVFLKNLEDGIYQNWYLKKKKNIRWPWHCRNCLKAWHKYRAFLSGDELYPKTVKGRWTYVQWNLTDLERKHMSEIDFVKATKPLSKFLERMEISQKLATEAKLTKLKGYPTNRSAYDSVLYLSHQSPNQTCYSRKTVESKGYRKNEDNLVFKPDAYKKWLSDIILYIHHPGQFERTTRKILRIATQGNSFGEDLLYLSDYKYEIEIKRIDIKRKREDANDPCNSEIDITEDYEWIKHAIEIVKCVPPFWKAFYDWRNSTYPTCTESYDFKKISNLINDPFERPIVAASYKQPCSQMSFGASQYFHKSRGKNYRPGSGKLFIKIRYAEDTYHETKYIRKVTMDTFWSSSGGFIGMFLGYSVLQVPHFFTVCILWGINKNN